MRFVLKVWIAPFRRMREKTYRPEKGQLWGSPRQPLAVLQKLLTFQGHKETMVVVTCRESKFPTARRSYKSVRERLGHLKKKFFYACYNRRLCHLRQLLVAGKGLCDVMGLRRKMHTLGSRNALRRKRVPGPSVEFRRPWIAESTGQVKENPFWFRTVQPLDGFQKCELPMLLISRRPTQRQSRNCKALTQPP